MNVNNFKRLLVSLFVGFLFTAVPEAYVWAAEECEIVQVDKLNPIYTANLNPYHIKSQIELIKTERGLTASKAKGVVGELVARDIIEHAFTWPDGIRRVSITTMFKNFGCQVEEYLRDHADRGIDDVFVVLRGDGWIDQRYNPVFHEAKYDGRCRIILKDTITLCEQLSVNWLNGNIHKAATRTKARICFDDQNEFIFQTCQFCKAKFQENIEWLGDMLENGIFYRTTSLLCSDGTFKIYNVNS